jgi:methionyl-tRNA formyltransferase
MLDHILLLSDEVERTFLAETLRAAAPKIDIRHCTDAAKLVEIDPKILPNARLVTFSVEAAIPQQVLGALGHGAYNVHPGSPAYPGWMPAAFATYDSAPEFGATVHSLSGQDGNGGIIAIDTFPVPKDATRADLARAAYLAMLGLVKRLAVALTTHPGPLPALQMTWGPRRGTRALFASLCDIPPDIDAAELRRRIQGFGGGDGISVPTVWLHGVAFRHVTPTTEGQL